MNIFDYRFRPEAISKVCHNLTVFKEDNFMDLLEILNNLFVRGQKLRALTLQEVGFIACVHRTSILTLNHSVVDGNHVGASPTSRPELIRSSFASTYAHIGPLTTNHVSSVFNALQEVDFASMYEVARPLERRAAHWIAKPSEFWDFPCV